MADWLYEKLQENVDSYGDKDYDNEVIGEMIRDALRLLKENFGLEYDETDVKSSWKNMINVANSALFAHNTKRSKPEPEPEPEPEPKLSGIIYGTKKTPGKAFYTNGNSHNIAVGYAAMSEPSQPRPKYDPKDPLYSLDTLLEKVAEMNDKYKSDTDKFQMMGMLDALSDRLIKMHGLDASFHTSPDWHSSSICSESKSYGKVIYKATQVSLEVHDILLNKELEQPLPDNIEIEEFDEMPPLESVTSDDDDDNDNNYIIEDYFTIGQLIATDFKANGFNDSRASVMLTSFERFLNSEQWDDMLNGYLSVMGNEE